MQRRTSFYALLAFTTLVAVFLILPVVLSILAGLTQNYFVGLSSGLTLKWVLKVWTEYNATIWRSIGIAALAWFARWYWVFQRRMCCNAPKANGRAQWKNCS